MTREEANVWIENNFFGDLSEGEMEENLKCMAKKIYDDFESRTCENCKYFEISLGMKNAQYYCGNIGNGQPSFNNAISYQNMSIEKDFGCNKWESK